MDELVAARGIAADTSESRHKIINSALESMRVCDADPRCVWNVVRSSDVWNGIPSLKLR